MNPVTLLLSTLFVACLSWVLTPSEAVATEHDSIYVEVHISAGQYEKWLKSPMRHMHDFNDWGEMTDEWSPEWLQHYYKWDFATMADLIGTVKKEAAADEQEFSWTSRPYVNYDAEAGIFTFAQLLYDENYINFMLDISAYRTLADFKDTDEPDFLVIYPFFWDPGYTVILEIGRGYTKFHNQETAPAAFRDFIKKADAHFKAETERYE